MNSPAPARVVITTESGATGAHERALQLGARLVLPCFSPESAPVDALRLVVAEGRLELRGPVGSKDRPVLVDLVADSARSRGVAAGAGKELIARAVGLKGGPLFVVDATAGFMRDALVLAQLGCRVHAIERSPIVAALVEDGIARARASRRHKILDALDRLTLTCADAREILAGMSPGGRQGQVQHGHGAHSHARGVAVPRESECAPSPTHDHDLPGVICLDPMYPPSRKSALNRKELRMLRAVVGDDPDAPELFALACHVAQRRVVVKRPRHAPPLAPNPDIQYKGASVRYDVYLARPSPEGGVSE